MKTKITINQLIFAVSLILVPLITYVAATTLYMIWVMSSMVNPTGFYILTIAFIIVTWALMVGLLVLVMVKVRPSK